MWSYFFIQGGLRVVAKVPTKGALSGTELLDGTGCRGEGGRDGPSKIFITDGRVLLRDGSASWPQPPFYVFFFFLLPFCLRASECRFLFAAAKLSFRYDDQKAQAGCAKKQRDCGRARRKC